MGKRLYVLGHPVGHSKSPVMHNAAYRALGLDWRYDFMDCLTGEDARAFLARTDWLAINITMPYKPLAFALATHVRDEARLVQGANVLVRTSDGLWADNTDGRGCVSYLKRCGVDFHDAAVAVCGTGPTSQAIMHAALESGAAGAWLLGRDGRKARAVLDAYRERLAFGAGFRKRMEAGSYDACAQDIARADIIVDATPLGMKEGDPAPFDPGLLSTHQVVFDAVYGHGVTTLVGAARSLGCRAFDGAGMLVAQAVETVYDIVDVLRLPIDPHSIDLFDVMAQAADFDL